MVVVPQTTRTLHIGVVIVLEFAGVGDILGPAVKGRAGVRTVEVDRVGILSMVDEPHDALRASGHDERRPGRHAVVADKLCWAQVGVDVFTERFDFNLVVKNVLSRYRIGEGPSYEGTSQRLITSLEILSNVGLEQLTSSAP